MLPNHHEYYYTEKEVFGGALDNIHAFVMKNYDIGMHIQQFPEINIIIRGEGKHYIEDSCTPARAGDIFFVPAQIRHGYLGGDGFDVFHVLIHSRFIERHSADFHTLESYFDLFSAEPLMRASAKKPLHLHLSGEEFDRVRALLSQMEEYPDHTLASDCLARSGLTMVLIPMLCRAYTAHGGASSRAASLEDEAFMKAISTIHEHYNEKLTISRLAKIANLSRTSFLRKFNEICKMTPSEYITRRRLEAVEYLLQNTAYSISEIAFETGFFDASHLNKCFLSHRGCSPSAFRKAIGEKRE